MTIVVYLIILFASITAGTLFAFLPIDFSTIYMNAVLMLVMFVLYIVIFIGFSKFNNRVTGREIFTYYNIKKPSLVNTSLLVLLGFICIVTFILTQEGAIQIFKIFGYELPESTLAMNHFGHYVMMVFALAVIPAIWEELIFRGLILQGLQKYGAVTAVIVSSLLFSLIHLSPAQTIYQFFFGAICAIVYLRTKNLTYPIILHFVNNFLIVTYTYITRGMADEYITWNATTIIAAVILLIVGIAVIIGVMKLLRKFNTSSSERAQERQKDLRQSFIPSHDFKALFVAIILSIIIWSWAFVV